NFFCAAPTYAGFCRLTIKRPIISVGENLGLIKTRMIRSVRKTIMTYLISKKFPLKRINIKEINMNTNRIPADALISRSLRTGILYPFTSSPNLISLFAFFIYSLYKRNVKSFLALYMQVICTLALIILHAEKNVLAAAEIKHN